jgi:hypothetical protein
LINVCSNETFTNDVLCWATGESYGFLGKMQKYFQGEKIDFIVTGASLFDSNSKSSEENLDLGYVKKLADCVLRIMINYN